MRKIFFILILLYTSFTNAQMYWQRPVINYERRDYQASNQNWMISQHPNGWMYFANNRGLLEYDGTWWNVYPMAGEAKMRSIFIGKDNHIYAGGQREFGYYTPNHQGGLTYTSLSSKFDPKLVKNIWSVYAYRGNAYFLGDRMMFLYRNGHTKMIDCNGIAKSTMANGRIWFTNVYGLSYVQNGRIINIKGTQIPEILAAEVLLPWRGKLLIVSNGYGIYLYDGKLTKVFDVLNEKLSGHEISCASVDGNLLAVGTNDDGLYILNMANNHVEHLSIENGLQNKSLLSLYFDHDNNLWLGLDNGIDYVPLNTPLSFLASKLTSIGAGYSSATFGGKLYLATNQGVYSTQVPMLLGSEAIITPLQGLTGQAYCLFSHDNHLFCGGRNFFAMTNGNQLTHFDIRGVWNIQAAGDGQNLLLGTFWGLQTMRRVAGTWIASNKIDGVNFSAKTMFVEPETNNVWVANKTDGIWRVMLDSKLTKALHKKCYNSDQLPRGANVSISMIGSTVVVASKQGLFRYDASNDRLVPYPELEKQLDGHKAYSFIRQAADGSIWYATNEFLVHKLLPSIGASRAIMMDNMIEDFVNVCEIDSKRAIAGTEDGFTIIDERLQNQKRHTPTLQIRRMYVTNGGDSIVYGRSFTFDNDKVTIPYSQNSIRLTYSASDYDKTHAVTYSCRLVGLENNWSEYSTATTKEYVNLHEGKYTFEVRAKIYGSNDIRTAKFTFRVLPPWYRSWIAYLFYIAILGCIGWYIIHRYKEKREMLIRQKDEEIKKQKTQYEQDIDEKKQQIAGLEEEKLRTELQYKSDELVKTTLNVVRKNESLQKIRKEAETLSKAADDGDSVKMKRGIIRLIGQIDTNMEHDNDLKDFQTSFDAVHHDFFKKLSEQYPSLNHKDRMLCAYIRMDLMSKEIAPLLNISVRGVEIRRYRLRQKLGLDDGANLAEFLRKI